MNTHTLKSRLLAAAAVLALGAVLTGCGPRVAMLGNKPMADDMAKIKPGQQTRSQVQEILGSPSSRSLYGPEIWYYISGTQESEAFFKPEETERNVIAISFDDQGVVKSIATKGKDDGQDVAMSQKKTPTAGHNMSVVEQMVGNIGRFNANTDTKKASGGGL